MNIQKKRCAFETGCVCVWRGVGGFTLINIRSSKNESETQANFKGQLIIGLSNYTGEFTNDFFLRGQSERMKIILYPSKSLATNQSQQKEQLEPAVTVSREEVKAES